MLTITPRLQTTGADKGLAYQLPTTFLQTTSETNINTMFVILDTFLLQLTLVSEIVKRKELTWTC